MRSKAKYFGKHRATVTNNVDPLKLGRVQFMLAQDLAGTTVTTVNWAMPCFAVPGLTLVPAIGAGVWIEFERGDPDLPIWTGIFPFVEGDVAATGLTLRLPEGSLVRMDATGIVITNGQGATVRLVGPMVEINGGALSIT